MAISKKIKEDIQQRFLDGQSKLSISKELGLSRGTVDKYTVDKKGKNIQKMSKFKSNKLVGRPMLFESVEELQKKIDQYFESCWDYKRNSFGARIEDKDSDGNIVGYVMEQVKPYTVSGLAVYLNTSRETLMNYEKRDEYFDTIKNAKERVYAFVEESLFTGKPTGAIFSLKNNYGWKDKQEVQHQEHMNVTIIDDSETAEEWYEEHGTETPYIEN